jgi:hypothetical protein
MNTTGPGTPTARREVPRTYCVEPDRRALGLEVRVLAEIAELATVAARRGI